MGQSWAVIDSLYCAEQWFCSHLSSYSHYLNEAGEKATPFCLNIAPPGCDPRNDVDWPEPWAPLSLAGEFDIAFFLDGYGRAMEVRAKKRIAQVAAICSPMPWEVRKADGSPAFSLIISSIPWMVDAAKAAGCEARYQPLAFDLRARACMMGVKRERKAIFIGTRSPAHPGREFVLNELADLVKVVPPVFGRKYFETLASATVLVQPHLEWARGCANSMKLYEGWGVGTAVVYDGQRPVDEVWIPFSCEPGNLAAWRWNIASALDGWRHRDGEAIVLKHHTYESRIPQLIEWSRAL